MEKNNEIEKELVTSGQEATALGVTIANTDEREQYDQAAKTLLGFTQIAARILQGTVHEYKDLSLEEVENCILGENTRVATEPVHPEIYQQKNNESNMDGKKTTFDVVLDAMLPEDLRKGRRVAGLKLIINFEPQNDYYPGYDLSTRSVYYGARLLSKQYAGEFHGDDYDKLHKVYSIWIHFNPPQYVAGTITEFKIVPNCVYGERFEFGRYDPYRTCVSWWKRDR